MAKIIVQNTPITVLNLEEQDYISLTDMASAKEGDSRATDVIKNWIRGRYTIEFLGTWEVICPLITFYQHDLCKYTHF